jgi:hypothetical protein
MKNSRQKNQPVSKDLTMAYFKKVGVHEQKRKKKNSLKQNSKCHR